MKNSQSHNFSTRIATGLTLALFVAGISLFCWPQMAKWLRSSSAESITGRVDAQLVSSRVDSGRTSTAPAAMTRAIETLRVGDRVLAHNPEVSQAERDSFVEPQWNEWLQLSLAMPKPDGSLLKIELLRPEAWVREQMALVIARSEPKASPIASPVASYSEHNSTVASPLAPYSEHASKIASPLAPEQFSTTAPPLAVSTIASPLAPYSGRGGGGEGQTEAANTPASDLTTGELSDYVDLVPYSPWRPIFRDLAFASAELEISGEVLQAIFVEMDLPELAITGPAIVHEIRNAPTVKPGAGRVITATFHHSSGDVIDLVVGDVSEPTALAAGGTKSSGLVRQDAAQRNGSTSTTNVSTSTNNIVTHVSFERPVLRSPAASAVGSQGTDQISDSDTIGTTSNHPFWSVDRQEYVQAGQLAIGERLQTFSGDTKRVVSKLARPGPQPVYNLEVFAEHVYYVGKDGVLVHNSSGYLGDTNDIALGFTNLVHKRGTYSSITEKIVNGHIVDSLSVFSHRVKAKIWSSWGDFNPELLGSMKAGVNGAAQRTIENGGKIHFNLDGFRNKGSSLREAVLNPTRITHDELGWILQNKAFRDNTVFYRNGKALANPGAFFGRRLWGQ